MNIFRLLGDLYWKFDFWLSDELQPAKKELKHIIRNSIADEDDEDMFDDISNDRDSDITQSHLVNNIYHHTCND